MSGSSSIVNDTAMPMGSVANTVENALELAKKDLAAKKYSDALKAVEPYFDDPRRGWQAMRIGARALQATARFDEAERLWAEVERKKPDLVEAPLNRARIHRKFDRHPQAFALVQSVVALDGGHDEALTIGIDSAAQDAHVPIARSPFWMTAARLRPDGVREVTLAREIAENWEDCVLLLGVLGEANPEAKGYRELCTHFLGELVERGRAAEAAEDFVAAARYYRNAARLPGEDNAGQRLLNRMVRPLILEAREREKDRDFVGASRHYDEALQYDPDLPAALVGYARLQDSVRNFDKSCDLWRRATEAVPTDERAWLKLAFAADKVRDFALALKALDHVVQPENKAAKESVIAEVLRHALRASREAEAAGHHEKASDLLKVAEVLAPEDSLVVQTRERISRGLRKLQQDAYKQNDYARVAALGQQILIGRAGDAAAWVLYARALSVLGRHDDAAAAWAHASGLEPDKPEHQLHQARSLVSARKRAEAAGVLDGLLLRHPTYERAVELRGKL